MKWHITDCCTNWEHLHLWDSSCQLRCQFWHWINNLYVQCERHRCWKVCESNQPRNMRERWWSSTSCSHSGTDSRPRWCTSWQAPICTPPNFWTPEPRREQRRSRSKRSVKWIYGVLSCAQTDLSTRSHIWQQSCPARSYWRTYTRAQSTPTSRTTR